MTIGVPNFSGARLREARLARGLYKKSLADMVGITGAAIGRYEDGHDHPQWERLETLADRLNFPTEFFLRAPWPEEINLVFWRSRATETKGAREMTEQRMRWLCEVFALLDSEVDFSSINIPHLGLPSDFRLIMPDAIERAADAVRTHWGLKQHPIPDVILALENAGIPVSCMEIVSNKQDGFCFRSEQLGRHFVGINIHEVSAARARYDAAHELGHLICHSNVTPQQSRDPLLHKQIEQQAHRFAAAFLFPQQAFLAEIGYPSLDFFCSKKKKWGMSIAAMIYRSQDLGLIGEEEKTALFINMGRRRWRGPLREPFDGPEEMPLERPRMLRRGIENILEAGIFGRESLRSSLGLPYREIEQITGLDEGALTREKPVQLVTSKAHRNLRTVDLETGEIVEFSKRKKRPDG